MSRYNSNTLLAVVAATMLASSAALAADPQSASMSKGDTDALAVVATVDRDEVALAKQAQAKKVGAGAMAYAEMMQHDHSANLAETRKLAKAPGPDSAKAAEMKQKGEKTKADLAKLEGAAYEKAYIDEMVKGHTEVLGKLDNELIPAAQDPAVKAHLAKTREAVAGHLAKAKELQAK